MKKRFDLFSAVLFSGVAALLFIFPEDAKEAAYSSLKISFANVIPVLFPFSVVSYMLISSYPFVKFAQRIPLSRLFGLNSASSAAILFGYIFGFPIGAKTAVDLYKNGSIDKNEAEALMGISNNSGPAFIVSVIGASFWQNRQFGILLYILQVISGFAAGMIVTRVIFREKYVSSTDVIHNHSGFADRFTKAVKESAAASLNIAGFICTFSVLSALSGKLIKNQKIYLLLVSIIEITNAAKASSQTAGALGAVLCAFSVGFSGLSVIFQALAFSNPVGLSSKKLITTKLIQGFLCAAAVIPFAPQKPAEGAAVVTVSPVYSIAAGIFVLMIAVNIAIIRHKMKKSLDLWR